MSEEDEDCLYEELCGYVQLFWDELDSHYSTDFFLCDSCIEEFKKKWAGIYLIDDSFKRNSIPLDHFYSKSKLSLSFSPQDYRKFIKGIPCPYCENGLEHNIWPYRLKLDLGKFSEEVDDIAILAKRTPFMLLLHPFAKKVYNLINKIYEETEDSWFDFKLYRCRKVDDSSKVYSPAEVGAPPDNKAKEGRFNHVGFGYLYVSTIEEISCKEVRSNESFSVCMAEIKVLKPLKILDITDIQNNKHGDELYKSLISSALLYNSPKNEGWDKPEYIFTRFIADCALYVGFEGIKYKSRYSYEGENFVIFKDKKSVNFNWDSVCKIEKIYKIV